MWAINLDNTDTCEDLCRLCNLYKDYLDVNLIYGSKFVDGASIMGVLALCLKKGVIIDIRCRDESVLDDFHDGIISLGAYWKRK